MLREKMNYHDDGMRTKILEAKKANRMIVAESRFPVAQVNGLHVSFAEDAPVMFTAGWDGQPIEAWRVESAAAFNKDLDVNPSRLTSEGDSRALADFILPCNAIVRYFCRAPSARTQVPLMARRGTAGKQGAKGHSHNGHNRGREPGPGVMAIDHRNCHEGT